MRLRWWALALGGLLFQLILFSPPVAGGLDAPLDRLLYVASLVAVLAALLRNLEQPWFPVLALGAGLNLLVIVANGGLMPADPAALAMAGLDASHAGELFGRSVPLSDARLAILGDNWAMPAWLPLASVVSVGDILIGTGAAAFIATVMRRARQMKVLAAPVRA